MHDGRREVHDIVLRFEYIVNCLSKMRNQFFIQTTSSSLVTHRGTRTLEEDIIAAVTAEAGLICA